MTMTEWAKKEVKLACERERASATGEDGDFSEYGCSCYASALKAFESLASDGHSGMSINITKHILNRLIDGLPLTPIEDTDDVWSDIRDISGLNGEKVNYQCKRMSSLFKDVYADGTVKYHDNYRITCQNIDDPSNTYYSGFTARIIDEMFPITMPYMPNGKYRVLEQEFLFDENNGDFDTFAILRVIKPDGTTQDINRFFKEENHELVEIGELQYYERKLFVENKNKENKDDNVNE